MPGFYPGQHSHGQHKGEEEEFLKDLHSRAYKLKPHEKKNIDYIEKKLKSGEATKKELQEILKYLEHFSHELKEILEEEREDHIVNMELEKELRKVAQLLGEVSFMLENQGKN